MYFPQTFHFPTTLEGYLYPETYMLSSDRFTVQSFVQRQLDTLDKNFIHPTNPISSKQTKLPRNHHHGLHAGTWEPTPAQRPLVSGIIWKRLDNKWNLGIDATNRYTLDVWNDRKAFYKELRDPRSTTHDSSPGLLPRIGNASTASMEAALNQRKRILVLPTRRQQDSSSSQKRQGAWTKS